MAKSTSTQKVCQDILGICLSEDMLLVTVSVGTSQDMLGTFCWDL